MATGLSAAGPAVFIGNDHLEVPVHSVAGTALATGGAIMLLGLLITSCFWPSSSPSEDADSESSQSLRKLQVPSERAGSECSESVLKLQVSFLAERLVTRAGYTALIPESYNLALQLGFGAAASGVFIGSYMASAGMVTIGVKILMQRWSHLHLKTLLIICNAAILLCFLAAAVVANPPVWFPELTPGHRFTVLLALRFAMGAFMGPTLFHETTTTAATPKSQMFRFQLWKTCAQTGGVGLGPLLSALAVWASGAVTMEDRVAATSCIFVIPWMAVIALSIFWVPSDVSPLTSAKALDDEAMVVAYNTTASAIDRHSGHRNSQVRSRVWLKAVIYGLERAFMISALEVATAYLLQVEFGWDIGMISCAIGVMFLLTTPLTLVADQVRKRGWCTDERLMCYSAFVCAVSALLLLPQFNQSLGMGKKATVVSILVADLMIFACGYLANGVSDSIALRMSMPDTVFSSGNFIFVNRVLRCAVRFAGPVFARTILASHGRAGYAACQLVISALGCLTCYSAASTLQQKS